MLLAHKLVLSSEARRTAHCRAATLLAQLGFTYRFITNRVPARLLL
ncbi:hypothetical protein RG963_15535 [Methanosarcina sp. Z-7115]|uniref:Uncharacterized protein n=1 Tax=Methanosarcina baikalica TaxID=3073890 RepID=A0ABU2D5A2_9EURY|nr:hypothetical protein [Methanosarcina sp. Z-7115]MDR7667161.1 hypothetical protein [Methanosarcina sp. Z-7115]